MKGRFQGPDTRQSLARRAVQGGLWVFASTYFTIGFGFLANIYLVRTLPVSAYGTFALAGALMGFVRVGSYLGIGTAFVQAGDKSHRALCSYTGLQLGLSLISIFLLLGISPFLRKICSDLTVDVALILAGLSTIRVVASIGGLLMERELRFRQSSLAQSVSEMVSFLPAFYLAAAGHGVFALVGKEATQALLRLMGIWWAVLRWKSDLIRLEWTFDAGFARSLVRSGSALGITQVISNFQQQLMNFIAGMLLGEKQLGFLNRARRLSSWSGTLFWDFLHRAGFHTFASLKNDPIRLNRAFTHVIWFVVNAAIPLAVFMIITAPDLLVFLYSNRWLPSSPLLRILTAVTFLAPITMAANRLLVAQGQYRVLINRSLMTLAIFIVLGIPLTFVYGNHGLCVSVGVTQLLGCLFFYVFLQRHMDISWRVIPLRPFFVGVVCLIAYFLLNRIYPVATLPLSVRIFLKCGYVALTYSILIYAFHGKRIVEQFRYALRLMREPKEERNGKSGKGERTLSRRVGESTSPESAS